MVRKLSDLECIESEGRRIVELIASQCLETLNKCWASVKDVTCNIEGRNREQLTSTELTEEVNEQSDRITICLDIDGTMLCTNFDEDEDVTQVNTRAGLREMLERLLDIEPQVEIGIFTAASPLYAKGARRLINDLVCGFTEDVFDFCVSHDPGSGIFTDTKKDLSIIKKDFSKVLLVDNDPSVVVHPQSTVIIPEFDYDPRGRDPVLLDLAEMINDLSLSGLTVPEFLKEKADSNFIYAREGLYYLHRYCAECSKPEAEVQLVIDSSYDTWDLYCSICFSGLKKSNTRSCNGTHSTKPQTTEPVLDEKPSAAPVAVKEIPKASAVPKKTQLPSETEETTAPKTASKPSKPQAKKTVSAAPVAPKKKAAPKPSVVRVVCYF